MTRGLSEIDAIIAADKSLFGRPDWIEEGSIAKLTSTVVNNAGVVIGGLSFRSSVPLETSIQRGSAILLLDNCPIQRFSFRPDHSHVNKARHPIPAPLRLKTLPADRTRIYLWANNRVWPMRDNIGAAEFLDPEPPSFMVAMQRFLEACGISAYLPEPPHRPKLELE